MVNSGDRREFDFKVVLVIITIVVVVIFLTLILYNLYAPPVGTWGPVELGPAVPE
jgi:hypothetical protein